MVGFLGVRALTGLWHSDLAAMLLVSAATLAQGLIACIVMRTVPMRVRDRLTCDAGTRAEYHSSQGSTWVYVLRRWPALLAGCLTYSVLLTVAQTLVPPPAQVLQGRLEETTLPANIPAETAHFYRFGRSVLTNTVQALTPDPGIPLGRVVGTANITTQPARLPELCTDTSFISSQINNDRVDEYIAAHCTISTSPTDGLLVVLGVALFIATDILLRFRVAAAFAVDSASRRPTLLAPLLGSIRIGWRHFGTVALHIWTLRMAIVTFQTLFCTLPVLVVQQIVLPGVTAYLPSLAGYTPTLVTITSAGVAVVSALITAFSTVYDAKLFLAIRRV
jgi:hypothetical protein